MQVVTGVSHLDPEVGIVHRSPQSCHHMEWHKPLQS